MADELTRRAGIRPEAAQAWVAGVTYAGQALRAGLSVALGAGDD